MTANRAFGPALAALRTLPERLCVGIDPHRQTLLDWGLSDSVHGLRTFGVTIVEQAVASGVTLLKPQVAFFERHGTSGLTALSEIIGLARDKGLLVIADAKRGDVGSTVDAYADAWLGSGSDLSADALTAVAYQGVGSIEPLVEAALKNDKGLFVLVNTSNPDGWDIQRATTPSGRTVAQEIFDHLVERHTSSGTSNWLGAVIGATLAPTERAVDPGDGRGLWILTPGFGHQGAKLSRARDIYGDAVGRVIPTVSRSITALGPDNVAESIAHHLRELGNDPI